MTELSGKIVLITGACGGFGRHMTRQFAAAGSRVVLTDLQESELQSLKAELGGETGVDSATFAADLSTAAGCQDLAGFCAGRDLNPDVLVNNAGIAVAGRIDHVPAPRWETLMQLNLLAPMRLCHLLVPGMLARGSGHIVNISSLAGWIGSPGLTAYCASKFGLRGFGEALAADLEQQGIEVTSVYPCFSRTPILDSEQFGYEARREVPERLISDPAAVVAAIIRGVQQNRKEVFPDPYSRRIHYLKRFLPWVIPSLNRRMQAAMIARSEGVS